MTWTISSLSATLFPLPSPNTLIATIDITLYRCPPTSGFPMLFFLSFTHSSLPITAFLMYYVTFRLKEPGMTHSYPNLFMGNLLKITWNRKFRKLTFGSSLMMISFCCGSNAMMSYSVSFSASIIALSSNLLYCILFMGWLLLPKCTATFSDLLCSPKFRYY